MSKIGIGIVTYNRLEYLQRAVAGVRRHTTSDYELVVAEDGGTDGTREWCAGEGIRVVSGDNGGVCWNKNRALFTLQELGCDPILLLEDDCLPVADDWDWDWRIATALFGHLAYAHPKLERWLLGGSGTPTDPFINYKATAQCSSVSGAGLAEIGFFDSRFKGYGVGHAEWTTRLKHAGYGYKDAIDQQGRKVKANLYITGGLTADDAPTFKDRDTIARNEALFDELKKEPPYRHPWSDEAERARFVAELAASGIGTRRYDKMMKDADDPSPLVRTRQLHPYGRAFRRAFNERNSFLRTSGWLASMALGIPAAYGEIVPWFNYAAIHLLQERVRPDWSVFEFGAGYSTYWWSGKVRRVQSVEHDVGWATLVTRLLKGRAATIATRPADDDFAAAIDAAEGPFDVIVVDGHDRPACLRRAVPHLTPSGVLILDNSNRGAYREVIAETKASGFKELRLTGPAPMTQKEETTSFFYRADNCLDL